MDNTLVLISPGAFSILIMFALIAATVTPVIMLGLLIRDKRKGKLW